VTALLATPRVPFAATIGLLDDRVRARIAGISHRADDSRCPKHDQLAHLRVAHVTFTGEVGEGELIVAAALAPRALELFRRLYAIGFPIRRLALVDEFGASDDASMAADNSSAFNFRVVAGTNVLSQHALGRAIDLNPVENPWRRADRIDPPAGEAFADRTVVRPGMIVRPGPVVAALDELGWEWGGDWRHARDDHHVVWSRPL
jgi:poly-gamma-glutamate synthesis protein (capsule biosynthesis protein)